MNSTLRALVDLRDRTLQKSRVAFGLRVGAVERGADVMDDAQKALLERWQKRFDELEREADADIAELVGGFPIYDQLSSLKGIGPMLAAKLIAMIDINEADT